MYISHAKQIKQNFHNCNEIMGRFGGLKTLCPFWFALESGMVFEETKGAYMYECIYIYRFQF